VNSTPVSTSAHSSSDLSIRSSSTVFVPPKGLKKASGEENLGDFGAEAIKQKLANGCELWAIRLPEGVSTDLKKLSYFATILTGKRMRCSSSYGISTRPNSSFLMLVQARRRSSGLLTRRRQTTRCTL